MNKWFLTILIISIFCFCNSKNQPGSQFKKEIHPEDSFWLKIKLTADSLIGLKSLESGVDSFELRLWEDPQLVYGDHIFRIAYENGKWIAQKIFFVDHLQDTSTINLTSNIILKGNSSFDTSRILSLNSEKLMKLIEKYNIDSIPTQVSLPGYKGCCLDGTVYYLEIATKHSYKFIVYENPDCCNENMLENRAFIDFAQAFWTLFPGLEQCWPLCWKKEE